MLSPLGQGEALQFYGPHFITNIEGLILDLEKSEGRDISRVTSNKFNGEFNQQWLLLPDPKETNSFAIVSLYDGKYLTMRSSDAPTDGPAVLAGRSPFYWKLSYFDSIFNIIAPGAVNEPVKKLSLSSTLGVDPQSCTTSTHLEANESVNLLILKDTSDNRSALGTNAIESYTVPGMAAYYTPGTPFRITIFNHLESPLYAAVSASGSGSTVVYPIGPGRSDSWARSTDESVHVSLGGYLGGQNAQIFPGRPGKVLHIQRLDVDPIWKGAKSVLVEDATYTPEPSHTEQSYITVQNDLPFDIYVSVLKSGAVPDGATAQFTIKRGSSDKWAREFSEAVIVGLGSAPGAPRIYLGRIGYILHIKDLS